MSHLIEVAFKGNRKEFFLWDGDDPPQLKAPVIVEGDRGEDLGVVHALGGAAEHRFAGVSHGAALFGGGSAAAPTKRALRLATDDEVRRSADLAEQNESARRKAIERVKAHGLVMKVSDAEWQWDRRKLTLYFTAEKRVDFRGLVRDLAALFRTRIELKQIGVRDEAKRLSGIGRCGREYCSASWLPELRPVNLSVAKDQHLSLNPTQISGACGRLMCSLRYEHEFYVQARKRFPKEGKVLVTARGEEKVIANDIFRDRVTLRALDGETRVVPLADLRQELATLGEREPVPAAASAAVASGVATEAAAQGDRRRGDRRRADESSLPTVDELAPVDAMPVAMRSASAPAVAPPEEEPDELSDDASDDESDDAATDASGEALAEATAEAAVDAAASPRPRRRRGRRGGRRGRGGGGAQPPNGGAPPSPPAPDTSA
jgi:cell fate regulator YaaT (PSP1 superfamily)